LILIIIILLQLILCY